ncbi:cupin domain-containing protein [Paenibacillus donghaensis]|uniref:Cupin n=1 Tax=Paenibacillus donghaensis TaxID=414771 RepID=A0A2Z2KF32_9BACL|nr:cupin domain-containing protein [Paenibacillus donghaensis]ASA24377.1 cupin [Paenibacillus donghaensis]
MEKKNLSEAVEYQEARFTKRILFQKGESVVFVLNFLPGQQLPTHKHPGTDVYIHALEGNGTLIVDDVEHAFDKGEVIHVAGDENFAYRNSGELPASLYVVLSKLPSSAYAENV